MAQGKALKARERLGISFFEKHPKYKPLDAMIIESDVPDLYANFELYEKMRLCLLEILAQVSDEQA